MRARTHVREARPRFQVERQQGLALAEAFFIASRSGDVKGIAAMLADDLSFQADGGGRRPSVGAPVLGYDAVMKLLDLLAGILKHKTSTLVRVAFISGLPGFITREADGELQTTALDIEDGKIAAIYVMRNPDKLKHLHWERSDGARASMAAAMLHGRIRVEPAWAGLPLAAVVHPPPEWNPGNPTGEPHELDDETDRRRPWRHEHRRRRRRRAEQLDQQ